MVALLPMLVGCAGHEQAPPGVRYDLTQVTVQADAQGWYTFGDTKFKGRLVNGVPDGAGLCQVTQGGRKIETACTYALGTRTDGAHLEQRRVEIAEKMREERRQQSEMESAERQRAQERAQSQREAQAWLSGQIASMPNRMNEEMARVDAASRGTSVEEERAKARLAAEFAERIAQQEADPDSELNRNKRERERADERRRAEARQRDAELAARRKAAASNSDKLAGEARDRSQAEANAQKAREAELERERVERENRRLAVERRAKEIRDEIERKRLVQAENERKKAEREREARAELDRKNDYLSAMHRGITLGALYCPGGEGKHYVVGRRPRIKPEVVSCIDVHYRETCPGSAVGSTGVIKNFLGAATDCFMGDAATVSPTPPCKPKEARVVVTAVKGCE